MFKGTWGKRIYGSNDGFYEDEPQSLQDVLSQLRGLNSAPVKREWAKFAGTWGKRPFASRTVSPRSTNWSSLRGSWGKRGDWAQLRGVWGKKADEVF
ncbi:hypothetical protein Avbf_17493 [Armadillidium vulgare]|nr:hypothetical protein Avbf_17493 [Armadillidium vulgare]